MTINGDVLAGLAVLTGSKRSARALLEQTTAAHLAAASLDELRSLLPERTAKRLHAAQRFMKAALSPPRNTILNAPVAAHAYVLPFFLGAETERMVVVCCDNRLQAKHAEVVAMGRPNVVDVRPADIMVPVIRHRATAFLIAHNHPSGDPAPSEDDLALTRGVLACAGMLGLDLLDHLVVAGKCFESVRDVLGGDEPSWRAVRNAADG